MSKRKITYEERLKRATYEYLEIQIDYWCNLIDRYSAWEDQFKLSEAEAKLKLVKQYKELYEQNFLNRFKEKFQFMAQAVNIYMVKDYLNKYASSNPLFNSSVDLFQEYLIANEIINMEDIEL